MPDQRELRCLIAAGGTVGHVQPSLAVAEALRERGVTVTFAGSPDRVEARLVPEAGFEFDPFRISDLGHVQPSLAVAEALRERGVTVTFAGSPDRVEARLVPEAGFEFDPFRIS